MPFHREKDMYPFVCEWLQGYLVERHRKAKIQIFDTSQKSLARLIKDKNFMENLPSEWPSWDIHLDIVGFIKNKNVTHLAFVECKNVAVTLSHLSQLLGYCRVALPIYSFIISPHGISDSLKSLLLTYNRFDVLNYHSIPGQLPRAISIAKWDETAKSIDNSSIITGDAGRLGRL